MLLWFCALASTAQETTLVQVKALDQNLKSISNLRISLDKQTYFNTGKNGEVFVEITASLLPPTAIYLADTNLEAESWNYSNGVFEIIIRKKVFEIYSFTVLDSIGQPLKDIVLALNLKKPIDATTNNNGIVQVSVPINSSFNSSKVFKIKGYKITASKFSGKAGIITAKPIMPEPTIVQETEPALVEIDKVESAKTLNKSQLDSINSLTEFYTYLRSINMADLNDEQKNRIDIKFRMVMNYNDSLSQNNLIIERISDSSLVSNDLVFLTKQALRESEFINETRDKFNKQIALINTKIPEGGGNLNDFDRTKLLSELEKLDELLLANELLFTKNKAYYKSAIIELKNKLLNIQALEEQLLASKLQWLAEKKAFRKQLLIGSGIVLGLILLTLFFIYLARRFNKQKNALFIANTKVKSANENLENLIAKKTDRDNHLVT